MSEPATVRSMKKSCALLLCLVGLIFAASNDSITRAELEGFFRSISIKPGEPPELLLRFKDQGTRFLCLRNDEEEKVSDYGETMAVRLGDTFSLSEHHAGLEFRPLPKPFDKNGWLI